MGAVLLAALSASAGKDIVVKAGDPVKLFTETKAVSTTYDFEDGTFQGWAAIDADGDGYNWKNTNNFSEDIGHNSSRCVVSESWFSDGVRQYRLKPNNYLVSPIKVKVGESTFISFYAAAYHSIYRDEHFGVAISSGDDRMNPDDYNTIAEWTYGVDGVATQLKGKDISSVKRQPQTAWVKYTVDLRDYAGDELWIAIRHFDCYNREKICVDDITIGNYMGYCSWTNDNEVIGMPASGYGPVEFIALNDASGNDPVAHITTKYGEDEDSFTLTVEPMDLAVTPVGDLTVKDGDKVDVALTVDEGLSVEWTNDNPAVGLDASGTGDISFTAVNKTKKAQVANITVRPYKKVDDRNVYGRSMTFKVTVVGEDDIVVKAGEIVKLFAKGSVAWTCDNTAVGMPASGSDEVEFIALNDAAGKDLVANVTAKPAEGDEYTFTVTVQPMDAAVAPVEDLTVKVGDGVDVALTVDEGLSVEWTNDNPAVGLAASGEGNISFAAVNTTQRDQVANITAVPYKLAGDGRAYGQSTTFKVTVVGEDDIVVKAGETVKLLTESKAASKTYDFENGTLQGWTTIDADGDGYNWMNSYNYAYAEESEGYNSERCALSESVFLREEGLGGPLDPDNYLVSPIKVEATDSTFISFYAAAYHEIDYAEHFGVAVSTVSNTDAKDFETIAEWTYGEGVATQLKGKDISSVKRQPRNDWVKYTVDLRDYAGDEIWIAIRHFKSADHWILCVDDITIGNYMSSCKWTCNNEAVAQTIGMPTSGEGPVEFVATNDQSGNDIVANITTLYGDNKDSFTITVQPLDAALTPVEDITVKDGEQVDVTLTVDEGLLVLVKNDNPSIGLRDIDVTVGNISFTAVNTTGKDQVANITAIPYKETDNVGCAYGHPMTFKVTVKGIKEDDIVVKAGETVKLFAKGSVDWTCDNTAVGMPASGSNQVEFVALNDASGNDVVANVTAKPADGDEYTFTVTVQPTDAAITPVEDIKAKDGDKVDVALTVDEGFSVEWTNDNPAVGLAASGEGDISFTAVNKTESDIVANITAVPYKLAGDGRAYGQPTTFKVTVASQESGLTEISKDETSDALYFTVSGIQVPADRLLPGIYLRLRGDKADKVIVK